MMIERFIRWLFQTPNDATPPIKKKNGIPDAQIADMDRVDIADFRGPGYFDAVVGVPALKVRHDPSLYSGVGQLLYEGDRLIVVNAYIGALYSEQASRPSVEWNTIIALNGRRPRFMRCFVRSEFLREVRPRLPLEPVG